MRLSFTTILCCSILMFSSSSHADIWDDLIPQCKDLYETKNPIKKKRLEKNILQAVTDYFRGRMFWDRIDSSTGKYYEGKYSEIPVQWNNITLLKINVDGLILARTSNNGIIYIDLSFGDPHSTDFLDGHKAKSILRFFENVEVGDVLDIIMSNERVKFGFHQIIGASDAKIVLAHRSSDVFYGSRRGVDIGSGPTIIGPQDSKINVFGGFAIGCNTYDGRVLSTVATSFNQSNTGKYHTAYKPIVVSVRRAGAGNWVGFQPK